MPNPNIPANKYVPKTDKELKQLALDIHTGQVFTDRAVPKHDVHLIRNIFMPLAFLDKSQVEHLQAIGVNLIYEYLDKAGPRSVNGYPSFFSFQILDSTDFEKLVTHMDRLKEKLSEFNEEGESDV